MTVSTRSWTFRIRNGQYEGAIAMLKEFKASLEKDKPQNVSAYWADAAGEWTGSIILSVQYDSATSDGQATDKRWDDEDSFALSSRAGAADSPLELVFGASYLEMDI